LIALNAKLAPRLPHRAESRFSATLQICATRVLPGAAILLTEVFRGDRGGGGQRADDGLVRGVHAGGGAHSAQAYAAAARDASHELAGANTPGLPPPSLAQPGFATCVGRLSSYSIRTQGVKEVAFRLLLWQLSPLLPWSDCACARAPALLPTPSVQSTAVH
jgi:hypothetical protein